MKQIMNNTTSMLSIAALTLVFIRFFFPDFLPFLTMTILFIAFGVFVLASILTFDPKRTKTDLLTGLPITLYFSGLIIVLQLFGGSTDTPLSIHHPFLWIAIALGIWIEFKRMRVKKKAIQS